MNWEDQLFVYSECLSKISFKIILDRVTERGCKKLSPTEVMVLRLGRSTYQFFQSVLLSIFNEQIYSSPLSASRRSLIEFKLGRSINYSFISVKYLKSLLTVTT